ncbi:MAG: hypothetical protein HY889_03105 [Deltaproteobacteria bacterium]|nr:hypothetical protein [Deltaproteobacteria bacterium]
MLKKTVAAIAFVLTILTFGAAANDSEVAVIHLRGAAAASGEAVFRTSSEFSPFQYSLGVTVYGLKPNSIYSVWLSGHHGKEGREALGIGSNHFKTDGAGNGRYVTYASHLTLREWRVLEIDYHPDNDPKNTKDMVIVLKGNFRFY